ncbi:MAG: ribosome silencing factor [Gammaproteobacteria bacterium]|nr:ribosome silencing factor [Gammaproteobacteria bacterium]
MTDTKIKDLVIQALEDAKARDLRVLDVTGLTDITDYMLVATGTSDRHVGAVAERVVETLRAAGVRPLAGIEGESGASDWVLIDFGDVVVHVMREDARRFYDLEKLWGEEMRAVIEAHREPRDRDRA